MIGASSGRAARVLLVAVLCASTTSGFFPKHAAGGLDAVPPDDARPESAPVVRVELEPRTTLVGSPVLLTITTLSSTWFTKGPEFPSFELAGLVVRRPADGAYNISEKIDGQDYSGVVREYELYAQRAATYSLADHSVRVFCAGSEPGQTAEFTLPLEPLEFSAAIPDGWKSDDPFLSTTQLVLEEEIVGIDDDLGVGSAVVRTVTARANDVPAMFLPPLIKGLRSRSVREYPKSPQVIDQAGGRGETPTGRRVETVQYVVEGPGRFELPSVAVRWWNRETNRAETTQLAAVPIRIATPAGWGARADGPVSGLAAIPTSGWITVLVAAAGIAFALRSRIASLVTYAQTSWRGLLDSEPMVFRRFMRTIVGEDASTTYKALQRWRMTFNPLGETDRSGVTPESEEEFARCIRVLERAAYTEASTTDSSWNRDARNALKSSATRTRRERLDAHRAARAKGGLSPLNPR